MSKLIQFDAREISEWAAYAGGRSHHRAEGAESRLRGIMSGDCPYHPPETNEAEEAKKEWYAGYWKADAHVNKSVLGQSS